METPNIDEWNFPVWLVGICKSQEKFEEAKLILIENYGFVYSELEKRIGKLEEIGSLILPIPNINLERYFESKKTEELFSGWGIGRVRFDKTYDQRKGGYRFEFKYFADSCSWDYIKSNPMKKATKEIIDLLKPQKLINYLGKEISNPYSD